MEHAEHTDSDLGKRYCGNGTCGISSHGGARD